MAIQKLKNIVDSCLNNLWSRVISNRWKYDITQDNKFLAKNFDDISMELITNKALLRLDIYILTIKYLKKRPSYFANVIGDNKDKAGKEKKIKTVSNLEKRSKK